MLVVRQDWSTRADFEACTRDFTIDADDASGLICLLKSILIADETGRTIFHKSEEISRFTWARKELILDSAIADSALLMFFAYEHRGNKFALWVEVNGHVLELPPDEDLQDWFLWRYLTIPVGWLRLGTNEIVFKSDSTAFNSWALAVENANLTNRSAKSIDQGRKWDYALQGYDFSLKGEYVVRLRLSRYASEGSCTSPQIDLADLAGWSIAPEHLRTELQFSWEAVIPQLTDMRLEVRHSQHPLFVENAPWSDWRPVGLQESVELEAARFVQWRVTLSTHDHRVTPCLNQLAMEAGLLDWEPERAKWHMIEMLNPSIGVSSFPFVYQSPDEPKLSILREQEKLDEIVAGAQTEWEKFMRLRAWTSKQWKDHGGIDACPYDALVILDWKRNLRPQKQGGCMHYASVFAQACLALGLQARFVVCSENITLHDGGHFVCEVWSNDYHKWVMLDPDLDVHFEDDDGPLSALEIHRLWAEGRTDRIREIQGRSAPLAQFAGQGLAWVRSGHFHYWGIVPRNNQLSSQMPFHIEHGQITYHQNYFVWWGDFIANDLPHVDKFSSRPSDFYWTLNTTHIYLSEQKVGSLWIELATVTPNFAEFQARSEQSLWRTVPSAFAWQGGDGCLEVRSINGTGLAGPISWVRINRTDNGDVQP